MDLVLKKIMSIGLIVIDKDQELILSTPIVKLVFLKITNSKLQKPMSYFWFNQIHTLELKAQTHMQILPKPLLLSSISIILTPTNKIYLYKFATKLINSKMEASAS
tara:strand:- start:1613 stop:1930 length:318 start_codon:yes stop_codon:yes gene_type:complete